MNDANQDALNAILEHLRMRSPIPPAPGGEARAGLEKHMTTIMVAAILALGMWLFQSTNGSQQQLAVLATNVASIQAELVKLSDKLDGRSGVDAATAAKLADHDARLAAVEGLSSRLRDRSTMLPATAARNQ